MRGPLFIEGSALLLPTSQTCPKCGRAITQASLEEHPTRPGRFVWQVECPCGYVLSRVIDEKSTRSS